MSASLPIGSSKTPHEVVKAGDVVRVRVTEVDVARKRIGLSMRKEGGDAHSQRMPKSARAAGKPGARAAGKPAGAGKMSSAPNSSGAAQGALGSALAAALNPSPKPPRD